MVEQELRIGEVARRAGVPVSRVRYYEQVGLLEAPVRVGGQRRYDASVLRRLELIAAARRADLSLADIAVLLRGGHEPVAGRLRALAARRLADVEARIAHELRVHAWLTLAADCDCPSLEACGLFAAPAPPRDARAS